MNKLLPALLVCASCAPGLEGLEGFEENLAQDAIVTAAAPLSVARYQHAAVRLDDGRILTSGGLAAQGQPIHTTAEIYNPTANSWSAAAAPLTARRAHVLVPIGGGRFLALGGIGTAGVLASAEIYNAGTNTWTAAAPMATARYGHAALVLNN